MSEWETQIVNKWWVHRLWTDTAKNILIFDLPAQVQDFDGLFFDTTGGKGPYDFIFSFIFSDDDMAASIEEVYQKGLLTDDGCLCLAYPKAFFRLTFRWIRCLGVRPTV